MHLINTLSKRFKKPAAKRLFKMSVFLLVLMANVSFAGNNTDKQKHIITPEQAAAKAQLQYGGKVLRVRLKGNRYEVKILTSSGTVKTVRVSAR